MKRWRPRPLILITLLLLAGAVVNVAVAWAIAATGPRLFRYEGRADDDAGRWLVSVPSSWPQAPDARIVSAQFGARMTYERAHKSDREFSAFFAERYDAGWPRHTVSSTRLTYYTESLPPPGGFPRDPEEIRVPLPSRMEGIPIGDRVDARWFVQSDRRLPVAPIPSGFAINTLFYAVVVGAILALLLTFFPIRRRLRARRNQCPKCGYNLAGLRGPGAQGGPPLRGGRRAEQSAEPATPCPECGATR